MDRKYSFETIVEFIKEYEHDAINYLQPKYLDEIENKTQTIKNIKPYLSEDLVINYIKDKYSIDIKNVEFFDDNTCIYFTIGGKDRKEQYENGKILYKKLEKYMSDDIFNDFDFEITDKNFFTELFKYHNNIKNEMNGL